jgi:hypothetical protein
MTGEPPPALGGARVAIRLTRARDYRLQVDDDDTGMGIAPSPSLQAG